MELKLTAWPSRGGFGAELQPVNKKQTTSPNTENRGVKVYVIPHAS
jgi:hypothetical protein